MMVLEGATCTMLTCHSTQAVHRNSNVPCSPISECKKCDMERRLTAKMRRQCHSEPCLHRVAFLIFKAVFSWFYQQAAQLSCYFLLSVRGRVQRQLLWTAPSRNSNPRANFFLCSFLAARRLHTCLVCKLPLHCNHANLTTQRRAQLS